MDKPFIFVSCGQWTEAEKSLGKAVVKAVKHITGLDAFFAEQVQDLNGLDSNILSALRECAAFITIMHPRGEIKRPDGSTHVRASVWIEQEIAIAAYICRMEERTLPVIAFIHKSVGREGIRDLLHLNPIPFADEREVLEALPARMQAWKLLPPGASATTQARDRVRTTMTRDWPGDWKLAEDGFRRYEKTSVRADWFSDTSGPTEKWTVTGDTSEAVHGCEALCLQAGKLLAVSPVSKHLSPELRSHRNDVDRWLYFLRQRYGLRDLMIGSSLQNGQSFSAQGGSIRNLAATSARACIECGANSFDS